MYLLPGTDITAMVNMLSGPDDSDNGYNTVVETLMNGTVVGMILMDALGDSNTCGRHLEDGSISTVH